MIYQVETKVFSDDKEIDKDVCFVGKEPDCWLDYAIKAFVKLLGGYTKPDLKVREINHFTTEYKIKDTFICASCEEEHTIELTIHVTVRPRLTLD